MYPTLARRRWQRVEPWYARYGPGRRLGGGKKVVMQRAECVSGFDWLLDSRIAIEAYRSHARSHEDLPLLSNQKR
jgi:hypothetical protein